MRAIENKDVGLGLAIAYFSCKECRVFVSLTPSFLYDFVVDEGGTLKKVKIKTTTYKHSSGIYYVSLTLKSGQRNLDKTIVKFDPKTVDYLFVNSPLASYVIPSSVIKGQSITLNEKFDQYRI